MHDDGTSSPRRYLRALGRAPEYFATPGAIRARMHGCWLNLYSVAQRLKDMGLVPRTIIDVGASNGMFSRCMCYVYPDAEIHAFEPLDRSFSELLRLGQETSRVHCYHHALGAENADALLLDNEYEYSTSLLEMEDLHKLAFPHTQRSAPRKTTVRRLDDVLAGEELRPPILVKIDVQGYEGHVLEGAPSMLRRVDYLVCELSLRSLYKAQPLFDEVYRRIVDSGLHYAGQLGELRHPETSEVLQVDALFTRRQ